MYEMTVEDFLDQLREDVYCRLCPSPLGGVGVFAIRDIPDNTNPFNGCDESEYNKIPVEQLTDIHPSVLDLLKDVLVFEDGCFYFTVNIKFNCWRINANTHTIT